uniref:Putative secreted protein n=1 Tax=Anopheles triannulatus TaxID=58253 RepID=A0A2M4B724_9DIPT
MSEGAFGGALAPLGIALAQHQRRYLDLFSCFRFRVPLIYGKATPPRWGRGGKRLRVNLRRWNDRECDAAH